MKNIKQKQVIEGFQRSIKWSVLIGCGAAFLLMSLVEFITTWNSSEDSLRRFSHLATSSFKLALLHQDQAALKELSQQLLTQHEIKGIRVLNHAQQVMFQSYPGLSEGQNFEELQYDNSVGYHIDSIVHQGEPLGELHLIYTHQNRFLALLKVLVIFGLLALWLSFALKKKLGSLYDSQVTPVLNLLYSEMEEIKTGRLFRNMENNRKDDLGRLVDQFLSMRTSIQEKIGNLKLLGTTSVMLVGADSYNEALQVVLNMLKTLCGMERISLFINDNDQHLTLKSYYPRYRDATSATPTMQFKFGEGGIGIAAKTRKVIYIDDTSTMKDYHNPGHNQIDPKAVLCIPMLNGHQLVGVLSLSGQVEKVSYISEHEHIMQTLAQFMVLTINHLESRT